MHQTAWPPHEVAALVDCAPNHIKGAIALAFLATRQGDVISMPVNAIQENWMTFTMNKTRKQNRAYVCDDLKEILAEIDSHNPTTLLVNSKGLPWTSDGFRTSFGKYRDQLVKSGQIEAGGTFHRLRHSAPTMLAESDFEEGDYKLLLGHRPKSISAHYARSAKREKKRVETGNVVQQIVRDARSDLVRIRNKSV